MFCPRKTSCASVPTDQWKRFRRRRVPPRPGVDMELFANDGHRRGARTLAKLKTRRNSLHAVGRRRVVGIEAAQRRLRFWRCEIPRAGKNATAELLEWTLTLPLFMPRIALVIMIWIWPLTRGFCARWTRPGLAVRQQELGVRYLHQARARRSIPWRRDIPKDGGAPFDGLIASHKGHVQCGLSRKSKTPLSRMQFEIEIGAASGNPRLRSKRSLGNIKTDIAAINNLVKATMDYLRDSRKGRYVAEHRRRTTSPRSSRRLPRT